MNTTNTIHLRSEDALVAYLKKFLKTHPRAVQLDGSTHPKPNPHVIVVFTFSINQKRYKLLGDLTRSSAQEFIRLAEEHGTAAQALTESVDESGRINLGLASPTHSRGFRCAPFVDKESDRLKREDEAA